MELDIALSGQLHPQLWAPNQIRASKMLSAQLLVPVGSTSQYPHPMQMLPNGFYRLRLQGIGMLGSAEPSKERAGAEQRIPLQHVSPASRFAEFKDRGAAPQGIPYRGMDEEHDHVATSLQG